MEKEAGQGDVRGHGKGQGDIKKSDATSVTVDDPLKPNVFKQIDKDKDKCLTKKEMSDYLVDQAKQHGQTVDAESEEHRNVVQTIFDHEDKDKDGVISHGEFSGSKDGLI